MTDTNPNLLAGQVALVLGASRSIGRGIAIELGGAGAYVIAVSRSTGASEGARGGSSQETIDMIREMGGDGEAIACDCADYDAVGRLIDDIRTRHGGIDILINSVFLAGEFFPSIGQRIWETSADLFEQVVTIPTRAAYAAIRHATPLLADSAKAGRAGLIVNISGRAGTAYRYNVAYGVGKAAIERLTRDAALDLRELGVTIASVWPNGHALPGQPPETPRYTGRAIAHLAASPDRAALSGQHRWSAELGADHGFSDEFGHFHPIPPLIDEYSLER
ncbi:SDR family NAD(P)-dependent oxidoreductase [Sphingomonas montanisoli]|uniref:SDR family NAD(P)-dependent oxidoreductase n=1 Tax=Sphingomonas montanisoli TaxID=2606412 RepID=A0A5D9CD28_9SPHN|nr:SDR family NAD(P)-dependent oxidoreductase [Sphingomonas montanisoli]TZG29574.1 SDR family NAD(P)-dependent oxidoreductase [Sphingomonas montanisoli]